MAGFILVCPRDRASSRFDAEALRRCALRLSPDNIAPHEPQLLDEDGILRAVVNPVAGVRADEHGVCLGALFEDADWSTPLAPAPDGSYAIVRHDGAIGRAGRRRLRLADHLVRLHRRLLAGVDLSASAGVAAGRLPAQRRDGRLDGLVGLPGARERLGRARAARPARRLPAPRPRHLAALEHDAPHRVPPGPRVARRAHLPPARGRVHGLSRRRPLRDLLGAAPVGRPRQPRAARGTAEHRRATDVRDLGAVVIARPSPATTPTWPGSSRPTSVSSTSTARSIPRASPCATCSSRFLLAGEGRADDFSAYTDGMKTWERLFNDGVSTVVRGDTPGLGSGQGRAYDPVSDFYVRAMIGRAADGRRLPRRPSGASPRPGEPALPVEPAPARRARAWAATGTASTTSTSWRRCSPP